MISETGILRKMKTELEEDKGSKDKLAHYSLRIGDKYISLNPLLDRDCKIEYQHEIQCIHCGRITKKSWGQGYCYPCFIKLPETDVCILRPERCQAHLGISRDMNWSKTHCLQDHYVYLAVTGGLKVGVTRHTQVPVRWIDQGASQAILLAQTPNRHLAGKIEVALKAYVSDKTNWRQMLTSTPCGSIDLTTEKHQIKSKIPEQFQQYYSQNDEITSIHYPVKVFPGKVSGANFDKLDQIEGKLTGIKGQYLIFENGTVFNVRRHAGYLTKITFN